MPHLDVPIPIEPGFLAVYASHPTKFEHCVSYRPPGHHDLEPVQHGKDVQESAFMGSYMCS